MTTYPGSVTNMPPRDGVRDLVRFGRKKPFYIATDYRIIHEDADLLVVDKPSPLAVHAVGCYAELNLHSLLKSDPRWANEKLHFTHRLDAETSGVVVIAKNYEAARSLGKDFIAHRVKKTYHALVFGKPEAPEGSIDIPLGMDDTSGFQTIRVIDRENGETAATKYRTLWSKGDYSYLEIEPLTGRTHQIRAHLSFIGHPIVGDKIYIDLNIFKEYVLGGLTDAMLERVKLPRLALHASYISFTHPRHQEVNYTSPAPDFYGALAP